MIPAAFEYRQASSVDEAVALLAEYGDEAKLLAGGHSLVPLMRFRLATPEVVVDIGRCEGLSYVIDGSGGGGRDGVPGSAGREEVRVGALTRHHDLATSELARERIPLLAEVAGQIGDPQVRHRGTIGGSVAHADPASDLPAALLALRATMVARGPGGERSIPADEFFTGFLETALGPDEVLSEVRVPAQPEGTGWAFRKFNRRAQDWAIVAVATALASGDGAPGVGLVNMGATPLRAAGVEAALAAGAPAGEAAVRADEGTDPPADLNASPDFRRHLARVLTRRALEATEV